VIDVAKLMNAKILISGTTKDVWSEDAQFMHDTLQSDSNVESELFIYEDEHRFSSEMRENAYKFLDRNLV
jgi:hypothetical protein